MHLPEVRFLQCAAYYFLRAGDCTVIATEKPLQPLRDFHVLLLRALKDVVVVIAFAADLRRDTIETVAAALEAGKNHVCNSPRDSTVAVIEWMDCYEP